MADDNKISAGISMSGGSFLNFKCKTAENAGYVHSLEEAHAVVKDFETKTNTKFCCVKADKAFGTIDVAAKTHRVFWQDPQFVKQCKLPYTGVPFFILGTKVYDCHYGVNRRPNGRKKLAEDMFKKRRKSRISCKVECHAQIKMRDMVAFPEFEIPSNTKSRKTTAAQKLRAALDSGVDVKSDRRIYIEFPSSSDHTNHVIGEASRISQEYADAEVGSFAMEHEQVVDISQERNQKRPKVPTGEKCHELLDQIKQYTYIIEDEETLTNLHSMLCTILQEIQPYVADVA